MLGFGSPPLQMLGFGSPPLQMLGFNLEMLGFDLVTYRCEGSSPARARYGRGA